MLKTSCFNLERPVIGLHRQASLQLRKHVHSRLPSHCVYMNHGSFVQACGFFCGDPTGLQFDSCLKVTVIPSNFAIFDFQAVSHEHVQDSD